MYIGDKMPLFETGTPSNFHLWRSYHSFIIINHGSKLRVYCIHLNVSAPHVHHEAQSKIYEQFIGYRELPFST